MKKCNEIYWLEDINKIHCIVVTISNYFLRHLQENSLHNEYTQTRLTRQTIAHTTIHLNILILFR